MAGIYRQELLLLSIGHGGQLVFKRGCRWNLVPKRFPMTHDMIAKAKGTDSQIFSKRTEELFRQVSGELFRKKFPVGPSKTELVALYSGVVWCRDPWGPFWNKAPREPRENQLPRRRIL
jgi:hypothetical protein